MWSSWRKIMRFLLTGIIAGSLALAFSKSALIMLIVFVVSGLISWKVLSNIGLR